MIKRLSSILSLFLVLLVLTGILGGAAWAEENQEHGTGLIPPTQAQADWLRQNLPVIQKIHLNHLALQRINAERQTKGLVRLSERDVDIAPPGSDAVFSTSGADTGLIETTSDIYYSLPGAVDNSLSPAFPPIGNQGGLGSCASWATTYYQMTYETNLALGRVASGGNGDVIFSPKWTYNMINGGYDQGSGFADAFALEMKNGATTWNDFPYNGDYLSWSMNPAAWNKAINYRSQNFGQIYSSNIDTLISDAKTQLANGHVIVIATYVSSWAQRTLTNDPSTTEDDAYVGQKIASYVTNTDQGGHGMTVVGYNDNLWTDLNSNGKVDSGEKGAFKIANSWGKYDWNSGYRWVAYDALRPSSVVFNASDRSSRGIFWPGNMFTLTVTPYTPTMKAEVTLNHAKRSQLAISLGIGDINSTVPVGTWNSKAVYNTGGNYAFNGAGTAVDGTFYFDFSELAKTVSGTKRWFVGVSDSSSGDAAMVKSFKLYRSTGSGDILVATSTNVPKTIDAGKTYVWVDYAYDSSNLPPVATPTAAPTSGQAPLAVDFIGSTSGDPDGQVISYSWNFGDGSPLVAGPAVSHTYNTSGIFTATLTVTDNGGLTGSKGVVINVAPYPNRTPVLNPIGNKTVTAGQKLSFGISATDPDGNPLNYSASNLPPGSTFSPSSRTFSWTPTSAGTYNNVRFQVNDGSLYDLEDITIAVTNVNRAPVLNPIGSKTVVAGQPLSFTISASDPDGNPLNYSASYLPYSASFSPSTRTFSWTPTSAGTYYNIRFQVNDGSLTDYEYITITVTNANRAPVLNPIGSKTVNTGKPLSFTISASDPDGNPLNYSASNLPPGSTFSPSSRTFSWTPTSAGTYNNVRFQVNDGSLYDLEDITIAVTNVNRAPVLNPIGSKTVVAGQPLSFTISASDPDGNPLNYSASYLPYSASFSPSTRTFSWTPTSAGTYYNIRFQVNDGSLTDYEYITITVTNANRAPVLNPIGSKTVNTGKPLSFTISASDPDGNPLNYSASNLPPGSTFSPSSRTFSWTPTSAGTYNNVRFQVNDGSLTDYEYINITVGSVATGQISGTVKDFTTGFAIAGATVSDGVRSATSSTSGAYTISNVPAGNHTVTAQASGYQSASQTVSVLSGRTAIANFNLQKSSSNTMWVDSITFVPSATNMTVKVKVVNPQPIVNAEVMISLIFNGISSSYYYGVTNSSGEATFLVSPASNGNYAAIVVYLAHAIYKWDTTQGIRTENNILAR